ncbi:Glycerol-3-phosphate dehydrogenase [NAD(P)+] [Sulfitobacter noctilucicola]|uniref:Glycerol-3-phosphate dehydrogenase [NAD(P)+] n=1 Tax=Sulfitobacter noctilucicola TaxID=1342301 RepID=A0A7W6Q207_9RHOB|nr:NAD(P)H-dependent glycerol-3-phosphate dehydrogenase [Sulfitobacter noctilucicola]KIN62859.1 Glycerol-3-phosphate dehydrogenase [NAD(P)+] [Sulfitobacter noctilucicola]MBB4172610.1 glycerol-3-phosphate dehydrogenase (NAD(P)+) [Sulfitobacter noctilucicola]
MNVAVLGAGAFGTALAISLANKEPVTLWARDIGEMANERVNARRLPGGAFPENLSITDVCARACEAKVILIAVPMQKLRAFLIANQALLQGKTLVACCKGIELETGLGPVGVISQSVPDAVPAVLTGPSFATDIAAGLPTALTLACADDDICRTLQSTLTTDNLRLYRSTDTAGAELGGAMKNIIAIACGAAIGAGLGESARAALMTRGFAEMQRLAIYRNALPTTLAGLSGFGDLTLTCTSEKSRNYCLGLSLGRGIPFDATTTVEGAATALAVDALAREAGLDLPITTAVAALLERRIDVTQAMESLLTRPLKEE